MNRLNIDSAEESSVFSFNSLKKEGDSSKSQRKLFAQRSSFEITAASYGLGSDGEDFARLGFKYRYNDYLDLYSRFVSYYSSGASLFFQGVGK